MTPPSLHLYSPTNIILSWLIFPPTHWALPSSCSPSYCACQWFPFSVSSYLVPCDSQLQLWRIAGAKETRQSFCCTKLERGGLGGLGGQGARTFCCSYVSAQISRSYINNDSWQQSRLALCKNKAKKKKTFSSWSSREALLEAPQTLHYGWG